jgi:hypothetical protein
MKNMENTVVDNKSENTVSNDGELYENIRELYDLDLEELEKVDINRQQRDYYCNHLLNQLTEGGNKYAALDFDELIRIAIHFENLLDGTSAGAKGEEVDFVWWLDWNYNRNPDFFSKYFEKIEPVKTATDISMEEMQQEIEDENSEELMDQEQEQEQEQEIEGSENTEKMKNEIINNLQNIDTDKLSFKEKEIYDHNQTFGENHKWISDAALSQIVEVIDEIQDQRRVALQTSLMSVMSRVLSTNFLDKSDILSAMSENVIYRQMLVDMFAFLEVEINTTKIEETKSSVSSSQMRFEKGQPYSIGDLKRGIISAKIRMEDLLKNGNKYEEIRENFIRSENENNKLRNENNVITAKLKNNDTKFANLLVRPRIEEATELYCYVCFNDGDKIYYIGTTAKDPTSSGIYPTASIIKTKRTEAVRFETKAIALLQIEKIKQFYSKINRLQKISLQHMKEAYTVSILEYQDKKAKISEKETKEKIEKLQSQLQSTENSDQFQIFKIKHKGEKEFVYEIRKRNAKGELKIIAVKTTAKEAEEYCKSNTESTAKKVEDGKKKDLFFHKANY